MIPRKALPHCTPKKGVFQRLFSRLKWDCDAEKSILRQKRIETKSLVKQVFRPRNGDLMALVSIPRRLQHQLPRLASLKSIGPEHSQYCIQCFTQRWLHQRSSYLRLPLKSLARSLEEELPGQRVRVPTPPRGPPNF